MIYIYIALWGCLFGNIGAFLLVRKINKSWINGWTINTAWGLVLKLIPFIICANQFSFNGKVMVKFVIILYLSLVSKTMGYFIGFKHKWGILDTVIPNQMYSQTRYSSYYKLSVVGMFGSFLILASRGGGLSLWLFHTREAYIGGRAGNGVWYILFELFIMLGSIFAMLLSIENKRNSRLLLVQLFASYFTGSKFYMLGLVILILLYYDSFVKRIRKMNVVAVGIFGMIGLIVLLNYQSGTTLMGYGDYFTNFLQYLEYREHNSQFYYGLMSLEEVIWGLVPRALYPNKPYIYGMIRIVALFTPAESIMAGNTPSYSEFAMPYADLGMFGIIVSSFLPQLFCGAIEREFRDRKYENILNINIMFVYIITCYIKPVSLVGIYILVIYIMLIIGQKLKYRSIKFHI